MSGAVREADRSVPATVCLIPDPPPLHRRDLFMSVPIWEDGSFRFAGIPPGRYKLVALKNPDLTLIANPLLVKFYMAKGESVSLEDGSSLSVQLDLITAIDPQ